MIFNCQIKEIKFSLKYTINGCTGDESGANCDYLIGSEIKPPFPHQMSETHKKGCIDDESMAKIVLI